MYRLLDLSDYVKSARWQLSYPFTFQLSILILIWNNVLHGNLIVFRNVVLGIKCSQLYMAYQEHVLFILVLLIYIGTIICEV